MNPLFNEPAIDDSAEELSIHVDGLTGGLGAFKLAAVGTAQRPMCFNHVTLGDLAFDPQVEAVEDAAIATDTLLETLWSGPLVWVVRIVVDIVWGE